MFRIMRYMAGYENSSKSFMVSPGIFDPGYVTWAPLGFKDVTTLTEEDAIAWLILLKDYPWGSWNVGYSYAIVPAGAQ